MTYTFAILICIVVVSTTILGGELVGQDKAAGIYCWGVAFVGIMILAWIAAEYVLGWYGEK